MTMFATLTMLGVIQTAGTAPSWLRDTFFGRVETHDTAKIGLDYEHEGRTMAPFVSGQVAGKVYDRGTFTTSTFEAPYVKPKFVTNAEDFITKRLAGEPITGAMSPQARAAKTLGEDLGKLDRMITRREEWMVARLLMTGSCPIVGEGVNAALTFWTPGQAGAPYTALASALQWNQATADIYETLRAEQEAAMDATGVRPDTAVLAKDVAAVLLKNAAFKELMDIRRIEIGEIKPRHLGDDVMYVGRVTALDLDLYVYTGKYKNDDTGALTDYIPAKHVLMGKAGSDAPTVMNYGVVAIGDVERNSLEYMVGSRIPESWVSREPAGRFLQIKSRPLPVVTKPQAFRVLKVLA